ncbi:MAG: Ku protein [Geminicoccaceae bacterium]|nr:Ku protein [Geminicoccaceae bacterium]MCB9966748.1 Ku protein [Geminicoccaceae bacterium]HRY23847.1 Ku protein [Geminicoccaceae bacterium]
MAPRTFWKGYLKLSLVSCRVAMVPASSDREKIRFRTLNRETGNTITSRYVDAETGTPVTDDALAKAYEVAEDRLVILEDEELESVALESTRTIDIDCFVERDSIGWIWLDTPHYLFPDDRVGEEAFAVIREAMERTGTVAISRVVLYRRERALMLEPRERGIVAWTLRYGDEVRSAEAAFAKVEEQGPDEKLMGLLGELIEARTRPWAPTLVTDPVEGRLAGLVAAKQRKRKPAPKRQRTAAPVAASGDNVVSIFDALRRSLAEEKKRR